MIKNAKELLNNQINIFCFVLLSFLMYSCNSQQNTQLLTVTNLPGLLSESSGIESLGASENLWLINDSGNSAQLFEMNTYGEIVREVDVVNAKNNDWEDLASDGGANLFIGDFGNNNNLRKDLTIYTVNIDSIENNKVLSEKTMFFFEDQDKFPPKKKNRNFDVEGFVYLNNYFYLFTKNRSSHFDGTTKLYKVPARPGSYKAILLDEFKTCEDVKRCIVTGADVSDDGEYLVLLTSEKVFYFSEFEGDDFFNGKVAKINLAHKSQKEAICFKNNKLYITDEVNKSYGGKLYQLNLK